MIDTLQAVIQLTNVSTRLIPLGVNGMIIRVGMLAMITRVSGMRASPTISARVWAVVAGVTGCGAMIMALAPSSWHYQVATSTVHAYEGDAAGSTEVAPELATIVIRMSA